MCAPLFLHIEVLLVLFDFVNLTQVHNFMVSAQDSFILRRVSVFTVSFTGILQLCLNGRNLLVWPRKYAHSGFSSLVQFLLPKDTLLRTYYSFVTSQY